MNARILLFTLIISLTWPCAAGAQTASNPSEFDPSILNKFIFRFRQSVIDYRLL
jgi:hypothetical protein